MYQDETLYTGPIEEPEIECEGLSEDEIEERGKQYMDGDGVEQDLDEALRWFAKSKSALARICSAVAYEKKDDVINAEKEYLKGIELGNHAETAYACELLGKLYVMKENPDYEKSIFYLEKGIQMEPGFGNTFTGYLGMAYEGCGRKVQAIHWYREAVENYGLEEYRTNLYKLYLTGTAGAAKKKMAEEYLQEERKM